MTRNQIAYWELEETKRHNSRTEGQKDVELQEVSRHNVAVEGETTRHNVADESIRGDVLSESIRHNRADEAVRSGVLAETVTHNRVIEGETVRHNKANEDIDRSKVTETTRHNLATETQAANELQETTRHNVENESIGWVNAGANAGRSVGSAIGGSAGLLLANGGTVVQLGTKLVHQAGENIKNNRNKMVIHTNRNARKAENTAKKAYKAVTGHEYRTPNIKLDNRHGGSRSGTYTKNRKKGRS